MSHAVVIRPGARRGLMDARVKAEMADRLARSGKRRMAPHRRPLDAMSPLLTAA
jgi:hypothetical protein